MFDKMIALSALAALALCLAQAPAGETAENRRDKARQLMQDGNFRDAATIFRDLALDPASNSKNVASDFDAAVLCFRQLGENEKVIDLFDSLLERRGDSWRVLYALAMRQATYFEPSRSSRRPQRQRGAETSRVAAVNLMLRAEQHLADAADPATPTEKLNFYSYFANLVAINRQGRHAWRFTALTDLDKLPDPEDDLDYWRIPQRNAPVDENGDPVYYRVPASWDAARNDGERWRWLLSRMAASGDPEGPAKADFMLGSFLLGQFGVQTMTADSPLPEGADIGGETGPFAVRTLAENETIARLATGLKRFSPPEEFNHIAVLRRAVQTGDEHTRGDALAMLAQIFENRQQYAKAVSFWQQIVDSAKAVIFDKAESGRATVLQAHNTAKAAIARITGNNGVLETGPVAPAGSVTSLSYLFRNGGKVAMTAKRLDEKKLLRDIRDRIGSGSEELYSNYALQRPETIGRAVVERNESKYVAETVAQWDVPLSPLPDHYSRRVQIDLPFTMAGCYLIEAVMENGNTSRVVLWISDLALVRMNTGPAQIMYVADAVTGVGVPGATLTFTGYTAQWNNDRNRHFINGDVFAERTDADGLSVVDTGRMADKQWLIVAETDDNRLAYLGFDHIWRMDNHQEPGERESAFIITDRPVYRPGQDVNFKFWVGRPGYSGAPSPVPERRIAVTIRNPRGETVYEKTLATDKYDGADDKIVLDGNAPLGHYSIQVGNLGYAGFRLEEYKKPEFEVSLDTPDSALTLGDKVQLKVKANYYYGAPVQDAKVTYKIIRTTFNQTWTPPWRWDWLYGQGAWVANYDYSWYPGFSGWSCIGPRPPWLPVRFEQPELVAEGEGQIDQDGVFRIDLDTMPAKELFGDSDHSYQVTAEVTDKSRRTIVGSGTVVASRKPFSVAVWANRGYYNAGQEIAAEFRAMLPQGGGVKAKGKATLYRIAYDDKGSPSETEQDSHPVETGADGSAEWKLTIPEAGQYRIACSLKDANGNAADGSALLTVRGQAGEGDFRFSALELLADKRDYKPGETVRLAVNSENKTGRVLLVPRAERWSESGAGGGSRPNLVRLENGTATVDIPVGKDDQPNFFCQAVTVYRGRVYVETREIFVPPADKTLSVEVTPNKDSYAPGEKAEFSVKVTDANGDPAAGQCVVSVYDKSVDYIAGGSNVADIRAQFWSWKRYYQPTVSDSLARYPYPVFRQGDVRWEPIGFFGGQEADWNDSAVHTNGRVYKENLAGYGGYAGGARMRMSAMPAMAMEDSVAYEADAVASVAAPPAPMALEQAEAKAMPRQAAPAAGGEAGSAGMVEPTVRSEFADTALWIAALETDAAGRASFTVDMPENLTAWSARTWIMGENTSVGEGGEQVETKKNVIVRPQAPRFLTQKDQVVLSANLHNYLPRAKTARAELILEGGLLELADGQEAVRTVQLAAGGEARVDWIADARRPGEARIVMKLLTDEESDAAELKLPVIVHGARRVENFGGVIRGDATEATIVVKVPGERLPDQSKLELSFSPSIAASMLDALPYLIEYPYGCTEQTLNRFLPVVMTRKFLSDMGVSLADAKAMLERARTDDKSEEWKAKWGDPRAARAKSPVFDDAELEKMVKTGVERLASMQNSDGGWGWFSGSGERSYPHTTAVVVYGLVAARDRGAAIPMGVIDQGIDWLRAHQADQVTRLKISADSEDKELLAKRKARADNMDAYIYMILALDGRRPLDPDMRDFLYQDRLSLSKSALAMLGIALHREGATNALDMVTNNLRQYVQTDAESGTAWLNVSGDGWWWWYNDSIETQSWYLKFLARTDPRGETASGLAKYLLQNRKNGSYWRSTRDTASAIEALADYAAASGENDPDCTVALYLNDRKVMERTLTAKNILDDNRFVLDGLAVEEGEHTLRLVRSGRGAVYYGGSLDLFSLEDPIRAAGTDLKIERTFYKLTPEDKTVDMPTSSGSAVAGKVEKYRRDKIALPESADGSASLALESGDLVEVELSVTAKNDYEYLVFEDMKAAGLEAVELRSGYSANALGAYVEYRDQKVVLFVRSLPKGTYTVSYRFRAEIPGRYSALPTFGGGMYATDLFANSDEMKIGIGEEGVYEK